MTFDQAIATLDGWLGERVVLTLLPEGTVLRGRLASRDGSTSDGVLYALADGDGAASGVALALYRDGVSAAGFEDDDLVVVQGQMTHRVRLDDTP